MVSIEKIYNADSDVPKPGLGNERQTRLLQLFLVPKPRLGNASVPEALASAVSRHGKPGSFPGRCVPKPGLGNEKNEKREQDH